MYGVNLADLYRHRRWVHLLSLIDGLRSNSRFIEAMYADEEFMEMVRNDQGEGPTNTAPPLSTWTPTMNLMADVYDMLAVVQQTLIGSAGGKPKKPKPYPRPLTAGPSAVKLTEENQALIDLFSPEPDPEPNTDE